MRRAPRIGVHLQVVHLPPEPHARLATGTTGGWFTLGDPAFGQQICLGLDYAHDRTPPAWLVVEVIAMLRRREATRVVVASGHPSQQHEWLCRLRAAGLVAYDEHRSRATNGHP